MSEASERQRAISLYITAKRGGSGALKDLVLAIREQWSVEKFKQKHPECNH